MSFQQFLSTMYPGVTGWTSAPLAGAGNIGKQGMGSPVNPAMATQWTGTFTPPAGQSRTPYPINVAGPSSLSAPSPFTIPTPSFETERER